MVGAGSVCLGYSGQSLFLPNWFIRRRGLAMGLAFAGVGIGSVTLLPWVQLMIEQTGWRTACTAMGIMVLVVLAPINLLLRKRPEDIGLLPDGDAAPTATSAKPVSNIVDPVWAGTDWTLRRALRTARFWWISLGYFCGLYVWYAVQVHQTKYLLDIGFSPTVGVWALGVVSLLGIPGQIWLGHLSDRVGREWIWAVSCLGFAICFAALIALKFYPTLLLVYLMILAQGALGYGLTSIMGAVVLEIFQGKQYGSIFGTIMLAALAGGAAGPWLTGLLHDLTGNYTIAFAIGIARERAVGGRDLAGVARARCAPLPARCTRRTAEPREPSSGRCNSHRALQIADGAQETVGRRGLRIDQAVQAKAVLHARERPHRSTPDSAPDSCRCSSTWSRRYRRSVCAGRAAAWRVRAGAFRRAPRTGSSPCAAAENDRADPAGCGPWSSAHRGNRRGSCAWRADRECAESIARRDPRAWR